MVVKDVKQREIEQFLARSGWVLLRSSRHNIWGSPDGKDTIAIPRHGVVKAGVVRQVIERVPDTPASWR